MRRVETIIFVATITLSLVKNGARSRTRTGTAVKPRDFLTNYSFHCYITTMYLWSGLSLHLIEE